MALKKQNERALGAVEAVGTNGDGQAEDGRLTEDEVRKLTDETVDLLLKASGGEAQEWIEKGRVIDGYVEKLQPNGKFSKPDPFALLAERDDIPWRASQLRTYRDAYTLWKQMGGAGGAPKVDVTTVGLVLNLDAEDAKDILGRAAKEKLTTRQVAVLVKKARGTGGEEKPERITGDWKVLGKALDHLESEVSRMTDCPPEGMPSLEVVERLEVVVVSIQALLVKVTTPGSGAAQ